MFFLCTNKCSLPPATPGSPYTTLSEYFTDAFTGNYDSRPRLLSHVETEPDNESSSKVTRGERHASDAARIQSAFTFCFCVRSCLRTPYRLQGSRADGVPKEKKTKKPKLFKQGRKKLQKKKAADVFRSPLPLCLPPHLVSSTAIAEYRQKAMLSFSRKQVGGVDKQVAGDSPRSQTVLKTSGRITVRRLVGMFGNSKKNMSAIKGISLFHSL